MDITEDFYSQLCFADGTMVAPQNKAEIKNHPSDFEVNEKMNVELSGDGEHIWLQITKIGQHTDQVAKKLARLADISPKHIGFSGMKDYRAKTTQWFSVWLPGAKDENLPDWSLLNSQEIQVNQVQRHSRKLKRGTHDGNYFDIWLRNFTGDKQLLIEKLTEICHQGVPNYFGEQRFGRGGSNLQQAIVMLNSGKRYKQRQKRSVLLSSVRAWLFNLVLSERLKNNTWLQPYPGEPLNLTGSKQFFIAEDLKDAKLRLENKDLHTTAPLWGLGVEKIMKEAAELNDFESSIIDRQVDFKNGLEKEKLDYARRSTRCLPEKLIWEFQENRQSKLFDLQISFFLPKGQFATSVLREVILERREFVSN